MGAGSSSGSYQASSVVSKLLGTTSISADGGMSVVRRSSGIRNIGVGTYLSNGDFRPNDIGGTGAPPPPDDADALTPYNFVGPITAIPYLLLLFCVALYAFIRYRKWVRGEQSRSC